MHHARITVDPLSIVSPVRRGTFGSFVEHLGRCVYTGIFEPGHPTATPEGFRGDVLALVREMGVSTVRYPGGNFVSGYNWEDGVGPVDERPVRLDLAWHSIETNAFGLNEFMAWTRASGTEPMMAINLGTRGIAEAIEVLEYANFPGGTTRSDLRRSHGVEKPHDIRFWCLGNEMDGPWQLGHKTATEYGRLAAETARGMRQIDPDLVLVACGSSGSNMPTFGEWEREVLSEAYDEVDMISAHAYYREEDDLGSFLASAIDMDHFVASVTATADAVGVARGSKKKIGISFDEWNVWYHEEEDPITASGNRWDVAPRLEEDVYTVADAVVVGNLLISLLRNSDRVHSASQAQLVNALAPIMTEPGGAAWRQTTFHPFALTSRFATGDVLRTIVTSDQYDTARFGTSDLVDSVATYDASTGSLAVFVVNRSVTEPTVVDVDALRVDGLTLVEALTYTNEDVHWRATEATAEDVLPQPNETVTVDGATASITLPPVSWSVVRFEVAAQ